MFTIYHNPRCSKSRKTLQILQESGGTIEIIEYLKNPPLLEEIQNICHILQVSPKDIVRTKEALFIELQRDVNDMDDSEIYNMLYEHPKLIERPIVIKNGTQGAIGRPPENVQQLL